MLPLHYTRNYLNDVSIIILFMDRSENAVKTDTTRAIRKNHASNTFQTVKEHNPEIKCFIVEPQGAAILAGETVTYPNHRIQGGGYAMADLPMIKPDHVDGYRSVPDDRAVQMARRLAREEGIFAGFSAGANVAAAMDLLQETFKDKTAVVLICDSGLKYLSTDLWK